MKIRVNDIPKPWGAGALPFLHVLGEAAPRKILPGEIVELGEDSLGTRVVEQLLAAGVISALWTPTDDVATPVPPVPAGRVRAEATGSTAEGTTTCVGGGRTERG